MSKTHYRKVFKSDHLGVADLEDLIEAKNPLVFTIREVKQEFGTKVAGKKIDANIAYFDENIKPLVVNATNSRILRGLTKSPFVEDWNNIKVRLYIDPTAKLKGEVVGGVRINKDAPTRPVVQKGTLMYERAIDAYKRDKSFDAVLKHADLSESLQAEIIKELAE